jgi:hypothetical protein
MDCPNPTEPEIYVIIISKLIHDFKCGVLDPNLT